MQQRTFGEYLKKRFGEKVYKIPVDAGFTCPNIDGSLARGGCTFCNNASFRPPYVNPSENLEAQVLRGRELFRRKNATKFLVYFQSYTNTYAPLSRLQDLYENALAFDDVVGLCIGTRPDCVDDEVMAYLGELVSRGYEIWLELGQQSSCDQTLTKVNRGHGFNEYQNVIKRLQKYPKIQVCTHVMFGLPGEEVTDMKQTVIDLADTGRMDGIKFHHLEVVRDTRIFDSYREERYSPIQYETYRELVTWALDYLPAELVIHRLIGDTRDEWHVAPDWPTTKAEFINEVNQELQSVSGETKLV